MLIPSIDLQRGRVVQLVQGERLAIESRDLDGWIRKFQPFPMVQVIDLDAAMGTGGNEAIVRHICSRLPCQVGGGVRTENRARALIAAGAARVILGSSLFDSTGVRLDRASAFSDALSPDRLIAAVDSRAGHITIHGWKTTLALATADAVRSLSPFVGAFLYTQVDTEGTMQGLNFEPVRDVRRATDRRLMAAGGVRTLDEVEALDALGVDAVVGMAVYTGAIDLDAAARAASRGSNGTSGGSV